MFTRFMYGVEQKYCHFYTSTLSSSNVLAKSLNQLSIDRLVEVVSSFKNTVFGTPFEGNHHLRDCLHGGGDPRSGEVTCLGGVTCLFI